ncbi:aminopeptidase P N-terminal domain-containing protein [Sulfurimonas sp. SAG-AH-194-I05]|nr:aminopeptidase P N-terminal domain-containing protein [Sulfurimonas sp. SAG-AH-194-I05]MDF1875529.1 aminopeptidase P N-terminal domain-containing protein [Sulfurimonas sp. SAG-AH-194-I05]
MISQKEYAHRRLKLAQSMSSESICLIHSANQKTRSNDTEYPYRQNSNFYYVTGFKEDESCLMIVKKKNKFKTILFVLKKDVKKELWTGQRLGEVEAKKLFSVNEVYTIDTLEEKFKEFSTRKQVLYYDFKLTYLKFKALKRISKGMHTHKNIALNIENMRLVKSTAEIKLIQKAIKITQKAHHKAMSCTKVDKNEYELQAKIENIFKAKGAYSDAYTSIVACGNAANTLHYIENNKPLEDGELILIDAGCEYEYYASDITRTIPVNGKFTKPQKELYQMILDVQVKIISMIAPGVMRSALQKKAEELLCDGLLLLGILKGKKKKLLKKDAHKKYYPHGIGHWMGIDVHDEAPYKDTKGKEIPLMKGMVLTIEPGIYCNTNDNSIPKKYRGIGIRIEDDILVTKNGHKNLSSSIVKDIEDIEKLSLL